ncbi:hypothetical protein AA309_07420 [Microvirga vignae]|uniref:Uncharacterized protein n=1 Tax=Microvirga vignae TaxID=1225564 RepID=A0A0H1RFN5_9HYPH|nr:hypothetical protein [Microvirga vignae]KLK93676.1 hypothetical protein AA309_07420 [Microvirga vignae]
MNITLRPIGRGGRYAALLNGRVLAQGHTPIFSAARQLKREGVSDDVILTVAHEGSPITSMVITVGKAAALTVVERDDRGLTFENYRPHPSQDAPASVAVASQTAMASRLDAIPFQTENAFSDDHVLV